MLVIIFYYTKDRIIGYAIFKNISLTFSRTFQEGHSFQHKVNPYSLCKVIKIKCPFTYNWL